MKKTKNQINEPHNPVLIIAVQKIISNCPLQFLSLDETKAISAHLGISEVTHLTLDYVYSRCVMVDKNGNF